MKTFVQLFKEFGVPAALSFLWSLYSVRNKSPMLDMAFMKDFFLTFFAVAWWFGQWNRVKKQQKVEGGLKDIEANIKNLLLNLDEKTLDLAGHLTGGDSFCYVFPIPGAPAFCVQGKYALHEISAQFIDFQHPEHSHEDFSMRPINWIKIETALPGMGIPFNQDMRLYGTARDFNINFYARNGSFVQKIRFRLVNGTWRRASLVIRANPPETLQEVVDAEFPRDVAGNVDWSVSEPSTKI